MLIVVIWDKIKSTETKVCYNGENEKGFVKFQRCISINPDHSFSFFLGMIQIMRLKHADLNCYYHAVSLLLQAVL